MDIVGSPGTSGAEDESPGNEGMPPGDEGMPLGVEGMPPDGEGMLDDDGALGEEDGEDGDGMLGKPPAEGEDGELLGFGGIGTDCEEVCVSQAASPSARPQTSASRVMETELVMKYRISPPSLVCAFRCHVP